MPTLALRDHKCWLQIYQNYYNSTGKKDQCWRLWDEKRTMFYLPVKSQYKSNKVVKLQLKKFFGRMSSFRSSPHLLEESRPHFTRTSRRVSRRNQIQHHLNLPSPGLQGNQENIICSSIYQDRSPELALQLQDLAFKTPAGNRRSSAFARHLQAMQNAARKQEEMYQFYVGGVEMEEEEQQAVEQQPMTIEQNDDISLGMRHCFFRMEDDPTDHEGLNFFGQGPQEEIVFYSQNCIEESMQDNFEVYLDV